MSLRPATALSFLFYDFNEYIFYITTFLTYQRPDNPARSSRNVPPYSGLSECHVSTRLFILSLLYCALHNGSGFFFLECQYKSGRRKKVAGPLTYEQRWGGARNEGIQVPMKGHSLFELEHIKGRKCDGEFFFYDAESFCTKLNNQHSTTKVVR